MQKERTTIYQWLILVGLVLAIPFFGKTQGMTALDSAIRSLSTEKNAHRLINRVQELVTNHRLTRTGHSETIDMLYGMAAVRFAVEEDSLTFEQYLDSIQNPFNRTSFLNAAAGQLLDEQKNVFFAKRLAERTLDLYDKIKTDSTARPPDFPVEAWKRFMEFAQYPYQDAYARALYACNELEKALIHQRLAFDSDPEDGLPDAVERYARLLELNGNKAEAKALLLKRARLGKLNKGMSNQLQTIYIDEKGSDETLGKFLDSLQKNVQAALIEKLEPQILDQKAPGFLLKDLNGKKVRLSDFAGRIVVLDLWATWCKPCIASFPAMELIQKKHPEISFLFIAVQEIDEDPLPKVKNFIEKKKYPFTVLLDEPLQPGSNEYKILNAYRPNGIPAKYIIDKAGILRFKTSGFDTDSELINELEAMFAILNNL